MRLRSEFDTADNADTGFGGRHRLADPRPQRHGLGALSRVLLVASVVSTGLVGSLVAADSTPAAAAPAPGQITGNVTVGTAPAGFDGAVGVAACPSSTSATTSTPGLSCSSPQYAISGSGGSYTLGLSAGSWQVASFYELGYESGAFFGSSQTITVTSGGTLRENLWIRYQPPSGVSGTVAITGIPTGVTVSDLNVTACPASMPLVGGTPSFFCATTSVAPGSDQYSIPTLSQGPWLLYPGYYTQFGLTTVSTPTPVSLTRGGSVTVDLSAAYQTPTNALVEGTVTVTGAPPGFSGVAGVGGCPVVRGPKKLCANPQYTLGESGESYELALPAGKWELAGFYELAFFGGQFLGSLQDVTLTGGTIDTLNLTVPYVAPATVSSTVTVSGVPSGVTIEDTLLLACPTIAPYNGISVPIECVETGSPVGTPDSIDTLPAGRWLLYPGYATATTEQIGTKPTHVRLVSGAITTHNLKIAYANG